MRRTGRGARPVEMKNVYIIQSGSVKRRDRLEEILLKMSIKGIGCDSAEWINLAQDSDGWWSL
jgi:hypothetical protein